VKVLILHQHYNTPTKGGPLRSYYLAQALADFGFQPVVITAHNKPYHVEQSKGVEVHYLHVPYDNSFGFYNRGFSFLKFVLGTMRLASKFRDAKITYAISVPLTVGIAAIWIKQWYRIPFLFEVGDLWPDAPVEMGYVRTSFLKSVLYAMEKRIYRQSQAIVALSPSIKAAIEKKIAGKIVHLIPNMADTDYLKASAKDPLLEEKFGVKNLFVISYTGALGAANGLEFFLNCARESQYATLPIRFILCGEGAMKKTLLAKIQQLGLSNINVVSFQQREGIREILNVSDASFICYDKFPILETGSPHKYFDGLASGKLIIVNFSGWIREEIEKRQCGFYCDPQLPVDFVVRITPFLDDAALTKKYQQASRQLAEEQYSRRYLSKKFVDIIRAATSA
jgi:glycosyltransferase involved in cell wall biosynthesis